ncbi:tetratricopeptide repeat-containing sensor histidine kinase [Spirosoma fluminis]
MISRLIASIVLAMLAGRSVAAQTTQADSLRSELRAHQQPDTVRVNLLVKLSDVIRPDDYIEALQLGQQALDLSRRLKYPVGEANGLLALGAAHSTKNDYKMATAYLTQARQRFDQSKNRLGTARTLSYLSWVQVQRGDYVPALEMTLQSLRLAKDVTDQSLIERNTWQLGAIYSLLGDYTQALQYHTAALEQFEKTNNTKGICISLNGIGELYRLEGNTNEAARYFTKAVRLARRIGSDRLQAGPESNLAAVRVEEGRYDEASELAHRALRQKMMSGEYEIVAWSQTTLAKLHYQTGRIDSAIYYGLQSWNLSRQIEYKEVARDASQVLAQAYARQGNFQRAFQYQQTYINYNDTLSGRRTQQQLALFQQNTRNTERRTQAALQAEKDRRQQQWLISSLVGVGLLGIVAVVLWRSNRQQQRANSQLQRQQEELKATQNQLVQTEKMASLGELTAGIAHEIQNPLNFVNNFAEVSIELIDELAQEQTQPQPDTQLEAELLEDLKQNLQKISHHGGRASSIVRGMLQHSRASSGQREATDLNALADEYLRLAYHGLRAKDKTFNAKLVTDFDASIGSISLVPQDMGRVLLNLFTNAFYAVQQRHKQGEPNYQPTVTVNTRRVGNSVELLVSDNGTGIPEAIREKIFQPFFTTKPTGQGTGLGLSMSYDIVTKGHNGTLRVESTTGQGTTFYVQLPG